MTDGVGSLRIDKWLWFARVTKSRSLAQKLAVAGHVRLNGEKVGSASKSVRSDDVLTITLERRVLVLKILQLGTRRGPYAEARLLYEDLSPPVPTRQDEIQSSVWREPGTGRPTKRERRQLDALRNPF